MNVNEKIEFLSIDREWNILTRNAIELLLIDRKTPFGAIFVDFNDLHMLNRERGYLQVNCLIKGFLGRFSYGIDNLVIGRWFCGDEIIIISNTEKIYKLLELLMITSEHYGIGIKTMVFNNLVSLDDLKSRTEKIRW